MSRDVNDPSHGDFRLHHVFLIEAIDGIPFESSGTQSSMSMTPDGYTGFPAPNSTALHLNAAWKAARRATSRKASIAWKHQPARFARHGQGIKAQRQVDQDVTEVLFDFFEDAMIAASSSYYAIEAFCNLVVAERVNGPIEVTRRTGKEMLSLDRLEREVSTDEKLKRIVPDLMSVPSPASKAVWQGYRSLKSLRDSFTHFKRRDVAGKGFAPTALHDLLEADPFGHPEAAAAIIGYFFQAGSAPRWLRNPTWKR